MPYNLPPDPYKALGVSKDAKLPEIRAAHRKLVLKCHPDKFQDEALKAVKFEEFRKVQDAYALLSDDDRRSQYDVQVKLFELKKEMARGYSSQRSNPYEYKVPPVEPRVCPSASRSYAPRPYVEYDDDEQPRRSSAGNSQMDTGSGPLEYSRIEEGIKARNAKAYENLHQGASDGKTTANPYTRSEADVGVDATKSKVMLTTVPPDQLGMKVMNPEMTKTSVDIIAVHGLGAIPEITWKEKHSGKNWLADAEMLPKAVPEARIMRFGYDSLWLGKEAIRTRLSTIANKLLLVLKREREVSNYFTAVF